MEKNGIIDLKNGNKLYIISIDSINKTLKVTDDTKKVKFLKFYNKNNKYFFDYENDTYDFNSVRWILK